VLTGRDEDGFVPGAADLEERLSLVLELDLLVVDLIERRLCHQERHPHSREERR
jgi:hypothetical protein